MLVSQTQYSRDDAQHDRQDRGHALIATYWNNMIDQYTDTNWYHIQVRFGEFCFMFPPFDLTLCRSSRAAVIVPFLHRARMAEKTGIFVSS